MTVVAAITSSSLCYRLEHCVSFLYRYRIDQSHIERESSVYLRTRVDIAFGHAKQILQAKDKVIVAVRELEREKGRRRLGGVGRPMRSLPELAAVSGVDSGTLQPPCYST